jgi:hypothetical protein
MTPSANITMKPDMRILAIITKLCEKYERRWCYPSQETILELLERWHRVVMDRRTLNRHLNGLQHLGYIERTRRHHKARDGSLILKSTVYTITAVTAQLIHNFGAALAKLSTILVHKFNPYAVPKTAQYARHEYLIKTSNAKRARSRFKW